MHRILVIHTAYPGDLILTTPLFEALKSSDPAMSLTLLTIPTNAGLFTNNPFVDHIITYDKQGSEKGIFPFLRLVRKIRHMGFHTAIIPHPSLRSALFTFLGRIPERVGFSSRWCSFLYTRRVTVSDDDHEVERNLKLAEALIPGLSAAGIKPRLCPDDRDRVHVRRLLLDSDVAEREDFTAIAPGSSWNTKAWPETKYEELITILRKESALVLIGGEDDRELCERLQGGVDPENGFPVVSLAGKVNLIQAAVVISLSRVLVSGDSAPVHLASAMDTPVVVIYGPTVTGFGFTPYRVPHVIIEKNLPCRPCSAHGPMVCPLGHFRCMMEIGVDEIHRAIVELVRQTTRKSGRSRHETSS